jgi:hypothetical protein
MIVSLKICILFTSEEIHFTGIQQVGYMYRDLVLEKDTGKEILRFPYNPTIMTFLHLSFTFCFQQIQMIGHSESCRVIEAQPGEEHRTIK